METRLDKEWLVRHLRTALTSLYDPVVLRNSPLAEFLGLGQKADVVSTLRRALIEAIESLHPNEGTPRDSKTWRVYHILRRRYTEQLSQREVASDLGLSIRQLQREEHLARQVLADHLWATYHLGTQPNGSPPVAAVVKAALPEARVPTRAQELEWLSDSVSVQTIEVGEVIRDVLGLLAPLIESAQVSVEHMAPPSLPRASLKVPLLRQALLDIIGEAIRRVPGGRVSLLYDVLPQQVSVLVCADSDGAVSIDSPESRESLEMAAQLVQLCGGMIEMAPAADQACVFAVRLTLPSTDQVTVLMIDDNADALQLLQRYLSNSRYHFVSTQDPQRGLAMAEEQAPQVIVLDVMMPHVDGWRVLGRLREHPLTGHIPIVVCTILPQETLALSLGASAFMRKPVTRLAFLMTLDRQI